MLAGQHNQEGFTKIELVVVIAVLALVALLVASMTITPRSPARVKAPRIMCTSNQKQVALSFLMFAGDHDNKFPFQLQSTSNDFTSAQVWTYLEPMSNELSSPKILICPVDVSRQKKMASDFGTNTNSLAVLQDQAVSYFVGIDATVSTPAAILLGDRNVTMPGNKPMGALLTLHSNEMLHWDSDLHTNCGNIAFADGSVQQVSSNYVLPNPKTETGNQRLLLPSLALPAVGTGNAN